MNGLDWGAFALNLLWAAAAVLAVMLVTFAVAVRLGVHSVVDIAWGAAFGVVAVVTFVASAGDGTSGAGSWSPP